MFAMSENTQPDPFFTPASTLERELEIKKSRFIARAGKVSSREEALAFVETVQADYPDARHHCWAYLIGNPATAATAAMSDDGEPGGTAGRPILNVIQHKDIGDVIVVVSRYFGGIKLGAGGLVRAYSGATQLVLAELPLTEHRPQRHYRLRFDFAHEQPLRYWASQHQAKLLSIDYGEEVTASMAVPEEQVDIFEAFLGAHDITQLAPTTDD